MRQKSNKKRSVKCDMISDFEYQGLHVVSRDR